MELAIRIALATVLCWAAIAKLGRLRRSADALAEHGIPVRLRTPLTVALAATELALGVMAALGVAADVVGIAVAGLAAVFMAFLLRARARGRRRTSCGCFGGGRSANTLLLSARAGALGLAGVGLATGLPPLPSLGADGWRTVAMAVLGVTVIGLAIAVLALFRQVGTLALRLGPRTALELEDEGPPIGHPAPILQTLQRRGPEVVAFISLNCRMCIEVVPGIRALEREGMPVSWVREDLDEAAFDRWGIPGTPYVVHLVDGVVRAKGLVNTLEQIDWVVDTGMERERLAA